MGFYCCVGSDRAESRPGSDFLALEWRLFIQVLHHWSLHHEDMIDRCQKYGSALGLLDPISLRFLCSSGMTPGGDLV